MAEMKLRYALVGNPNSGKTTLFNALTGSNQSVGNWPGVTVEKKEGKLRGSKQEVTVVDLPGIYSLSPYSAEELVARDYIVQEKPDLIINIVDATNLERNLYLSLQLSELDVPMVLAFNMMDIVTKRGDQLDFHLLSDLMDFRIVAISASRTEGIDKLLKACEHELAHAGKSSHVDRHSDKPMREIYTEPLRHVVLLAEDCLRDACQEKGMPLRWAAVKWIEGDAPTRKVLALDPEATVFLEEAIRQMEEASGLDREIIVADQKYKFICSVRDRAFRRKAAQGSLTRSDRIDRIVTNRYLALPLFALAMLAMFGLTFGLGSALTDWVDVLINEQFSGWLRLLLEGWHISDWLIGLLCDGAIAGVGSVLSFLPQIALLFLFLSVLEDSGYMARGAFIMDRALHFVGLSGKSFVPMLMGFGCSVPALMATRTLSSEKDRRLTVMLVPFMSCSAKMPFYLLMVGTFFPAYRGLVMFSIYMLGVLVAVLCAFILQKTVFKAGHSSFVMELPPYRLPTAKTLSLHMWEKLRDFIAKAGTVLLLASIVIWALQYFDFSFRPVANSEQSILGGIGRAIAPLFTPLGFGDWKSAVAMVSGLMARESIVSTLGILYGTGAEAGVALEAALAQVYTPPAAYAFMTFSLLFIPCVAAINAVRREMNSVKWTVFALGFQPVVAWVVSFLVYQGGNFLYQIIK